MGLKTQLNLPTFKQYLADKSHIQGVQYG
jgi:hypothetical protein